MRSRLIAAAFVTALVVVAVANAGTSGSFIYRGTVTHIVDGDTLDVQIGSRTERIRVIGIDTPERGVCYANAATAAATRLASGKRVVLRGDPSQDTRDRYGRLLAYVGLPEGKDLGYQLIAGGFAKVYVYNNHPFQRVTAYRAAEVIGRKRSSSLWRCGTTTAIAPIRLALIAAVELRLLVPGRVHTPIQQGRGSRLRPDQLQEYSGRRQRPTRLRWPRQRRGRMRRLTDTRSRFGSARRARSPAR